MPVSGGITGNVQHSGDEQNLRRLFFNRHGLLELALHVHGDVHNCVASALPQYLFTALGWRCPHTSHSTSCCCSVARPAGLLSRISEKSTEVVDNLFGDNRQTKVSGSRFSSRTVEDPPEPRFCHCSRSPSVPNTEQRPQSRGPHQPSGTAVCQSRGARRHCPCQSPPTHRGTHRGWLASSSSFGTHTSGLVSVRTPAVAEPPAAQAARQTIRTTSGPPRHWWSSVPHSSERCGEWPPPVQPRSTSAHVATMSGVAAPSSAARSLRVHHPSIATAWV